MTLSKEKLPKCWWVVVPSEIEHRLGVVELALRRMWQGDLKIASNYFLQRTSWKKHCRVDAKCYPTISLAQIRQPQPRLQLQQLLLAVCRLRPGAARATFLFVHWTTRPRPNFEPTACEKGDSEQQLEDYR